jgi:hypothetical protein
MKSDYFITVNSLGAQELQIGNYTYYAVRKPLDNHFSRMIGTVIEEDGDNVEIVLHESGTVMVTKANGNELLKRTREFHPTKNGNLKPSYYAEVLERLRAAFVSTYKQDLSIKN